MNLLIVNVNVDPDQTKGILEEKFPELTIHAAAGDGDVGDFIEKAEIILAIRLTDELLSRARKLQWIHCLITGVDFIAPLPSLKKEVILTSTKGIHGPQMSELAFLMMLNLTRNYSKMLQNQNNKTWEKWPQPLLLNKSVGILGVGVIGKEIARKCKAFGMTVYGITSRKREIENVDHSYGPEGLLEVMSRVDYFINVIPHTPETKNMISEKEFEALKPSAYFINIGRGDTVDEEALIRVLKAGKFAGAGLDVFCKEPLSKDSPLWEMDNVLLTPHVGGMSDIYGEQALPIFEENLSRFLKGERRDLINFIES